MTVTWNGAAITGPVLIYQDELVVDNSDIDATPVRNGTLICRANQAQVRWHLPNGDAVSTTSTGDIMQTRTSSIATPSVSRLSTNNEDVSRDDNISNGLWTCRLDGNGTDPTPVSVGIYGNVEGMRLLLFIRCCMC